jgi:hypothetical protein
MAAPRRIQAPVTLFGEIPSSNTTIMQAASFDHWERRQEFKISEFLAMGLYFVGTGIRCSSCGRIQTEWNPTKNVLVQHANFNTQCPLVQNFYNDPIINYYFSQDQIMLDVHTAIVDDNIRNTIPINYN